MTPIDWNIGRVAASTTASGTARRWSDGTTQTILVDPVKKTRHVCPGEADCAAIPPGDVVPAGRAGGEGAGRGGGRGGRGGGATGTSSDGKPLAMSPDGKRGVFVRDWNLWVRDVATGQEKALTTDGVKYFGYATDNAGWSSSDRAILLWSPDSKKIATQQQDERNVGEMYLVNTAVGHPTLRVSKFPLPGDPRDGDAAPRRHRRRRRHASRASRCRRTSIARTLGDDISMNDYNWSPDGSQLALASVSRDHKHVWLRVADTATGAVRKVLEETVATQFESRTGWRVLWATNEVIWYSERDNWGQLYLYDLHDRRAEEPDHDRRRSGHADRAHRRDDAHDLVRRERPREGAGSVLPSLLPHQSRRQAPSSRSRRTTARTRCSCRRPASYLIDTYSKPDVPPVVVLRDARRGAARACRSRRPTSRSCSPPAGSRRCRSR